MAYTDEQRDQLLSFLVSSALDDVLTFGLSDDLKADVLHVNSALPRALNLSIVNTATEQVVIVGQSQPVSTHNYHFHIKFNDNSVAFTANPTLITADWHIQLVTNAASFVTDLYLLSAKDITLSAQGGTISVAMQYAGAMLSEPSDVLQLLVTVGEHVNELSPPQRVTGTQMVPLSTFTDASAPSPLIPTLVQPKTILIGDDKLQLLLRLVNTSPEPVTFVPPLTKGGHTPTSIEISIDIDPTAASALCKPAEAEGIQIKPPDNWTPEPAKAGQKQKAWLFRPDYSKSSKVDGYLTLDFHISGIKTTLPPGFTNLYVTLREFPLYGTQTIIVQIEKSPFIYNSELGSGLLSEGTAGNNSALDLKGTTTSDLLFVEQSGTGKSAHFKGGDGVSIENNLVVSRDARLNEGALWLRSAPDTGNGVAAFGGTNTNRPRFAQKDINGPVVFGTAGGALGSTSGGEKIALSWKDTGKVGVGTDDPKSVLSVNGGVAVGPSFAGTNEAAAGSLLVEKNIGIGAKQPASTLSVKGGAAIGSNYAEAHAAPADSVLVEGKVGIGTVSPLGPLAVGDASINGSDGYVVLGKRVDKGGSRQYRLGFDGSFNFVIGDYGAENKAAQTWTAPFAMAYDTPTNAVYIKGINQQPFVGIGTSDPLGTLSVGDASKIGSDGFIVLGKRSSEALTRQYRIGFDANFNFCIGDYGFENNPAQEWTSPLAMAWNAPSNTLFIGANGLIGIGTNTPDKAALEITRKKYPQKVTGSFGLVADNGCYSYSQSTSADLAISIYAHDVIWSNAWVIASSDARIKQVHGLSDGGTDLNTLLAIEVTDYSYIDAPPNDPRTHKKVVAQQVQKVFPQAVSETTNVVPDVYQKASIKDGWVQLATDLKIGDRVRLVGESHDAVHEVLEVGAGQFRTSFVTEASEIFVYGREVNDFLNVDYDALAMLNVSATQQLKKEKDAEIKALRDENAELRDRLEKLESLMERFVLSEALA